MAAKSTIRHRLWDILDRIRLIRELTSGLTLEVYLQSPATQAASERWLEFISEATRHIPDDLKALHPAIDWRRIAEAGNFLRHVYDHLDPSRTWALLMQDIDPLCAAVLNLYDRVRLPTDPEPPA